MTTFELTGLVTERFPSFSKKDEFTITIYSERGVRLTELRATEETAPKVGTRYAVVIAPERTDPR